VSFLVPKWPLGSPLPERIEERTVKSTCYFIHALTYNKRQSAIQPSWFSRILKMLRSKASDAVPAINGSIFLVGPMGVGKTTIGRQLALTLKREFRDSDREIEERTGASIPLIFELEGEAGFRKREREILDELTHLPEIVLATGGGVVLDSDNRLWMRSRGYVVYLHAPIEELLRRTSQNRNRPLLQTADPRKRLAEILEQRNPLYRSVADCIVETGRANVRQVIKEILSHFGKAAR